MQTAFYVTQKQLFGKTAFSVKIFGNSKSFCIVMSKGVPLGDLSCSGGHGPNSAGSDISNRTFYTRGPSQKFLTTTNDATVEVIKMYLFMEEPL